MKILFCTDGSRISYQALLNFKSYFKDIKVDLLSVSDLTYLPDATLFDGSKYVQECTNSTSSVINYSEKFLSDNNIELSDIIKLCGSAVDSVLDVDSDNNYDCIVMGSNGKKGLQKWLGSVSSDVASNSKSSVFISKGDKFKNKNILFPVMPDFDSSDLVEKIVTNFDNNDITVHLITVYEMPDFLFLEGNIDSNWISDVERQQHKTALDNLLKYEDLFFRHNIKVINKAVLKGVIHEEILKYIKLNDISLVITGMRRKAGFLIASVSRRVLENAKCDVMIYK